ncbi:MAG: hypothetical protein EOP11_00910 [Proteobacteria bacterium]|nr:MAG: hypothetical protein EOP11_00910 [Pseudomonadota bacterium]
MLKLRVLSALGAAAFFLSACSGSAPPAAKVSPETSAELPESESPEFSGMIPAECQALLDKVQDWRGSPAGKWAPSSPAQALEVLRFFGHFHLVPHRTANLYRSFLQVSFPDDEAAAKALYARYAKLQVCDSSLAQSFLDGLINYNWAPEQRREAQAELFQFVLNQQARVMPFVPRLTALEVHRKALAKGLARGNAGELKAVIDQAMNGRTKIFGVTPKTSMEQLQNLRAELELSEKLRDRLARSLPLP